MKPVRFVIPVAMMPYFLYAMGEVKGDAGTVTATLTSKGYAIEYTMSREDDNRVRQCMTSAWKNRGQKDLSDDLSY